MAPMQMYNTMYQEISVYGVVGKAMILECSPTYQVWWDCTIPDMHIWNITKSITEAFHESCGV